MTPRSVTIGNIVALDWAKGSKYERVAIKQYHRCPMCGESLYNKEELETHHIVPVKEGGSDDTRRVSR